jgi:hypothetical protein
MGLSLPQFGTDHLQVICLFSTVKIYMWPKEICTPLITRISVSLIAWSHFEITRLILNSDRGVIEVIASLRKALLKGVASAKLDGYTADNQLE